MPQNTKNRKIDKHTKKLTSTHINLTSVQVYEAINKSSNNNSTGPDNINIKHLKHLGPLAIEYLTSLLNLALNTNTIPHIWKLAKIIPIPKPNKDLSQGSSYRPISLLSPIAKTLEKAILPIITQNIPEVKHQHGFKPLHSTTTALHQITNQITQGFNLKQPPERTIVVSLDLSKAFDTVNIHNLIHKIHQTTIPNTIIKFISSYIKGRKGFTLIQDSKSKQQQFKTGVPQGGVLSPILFNLYTSDIPQSPPNTTLTTYADDMNPAASHTQYKEAENLLQPYLDSIFNWTKENNLILNPDKSTATLFTPDPAEYDTTLNLSINNIIIPTVKHPKILGLTLDPKLNFSEHFRITKEKAEKSIKILKSLSATSWGLQKETLLTTYKTIVRPTIEYASTVWSPIIAPTNIDHLQITQNTALKIATGCLTKSSVQHLHDESEILPLSHHLRLHSSQLKQKALIPSHPLYNLTQTIPNPRKKKQTIFINWNYPTTTIPIDPQHSTHESNKQNLKTIHHLSVQSYLQDRKPNIILGHSPPSINKEELTLPRKSRRILAQLRGNQSPLLRSYLHDIKKIPSPSCPLCNHPNHDTAHLFSCTSISTNLNLIDLWENPVAVVELLRLWEDALGQAGGGQGP